MPPFLEGCFALATTLRCATRWQKRNPRVHAPPPQERPCEFAHMSERTLRTLQSHSAQAPLPPTSHTIMSGPSGQSDPGSEWIDPEQSGDAVTSADNPNTNPYPIQQDVVEHQVDLVERVLLEHVTSEIENLGKRTQAESWRAIIKKEHKFTKRKKNSVSEKRKEEVSAPAQRAGETE